MPCQCAATATDVTDPSAVLSACECETESTSAGCGCGGGGPEPSDYETSLERVVMELDKRVRKLEATR